VLIELTVQNLVIVAAARLQPGQGLTVISGETGAGKSLLLDALALLLGGRADRDLVGPQGDAATVAAVFAVDAQQRARIEGEFGISAEREGEGDHIVLRRRLSQTGRSQAWVNDVPVSIAALRSVGTLLVDVRAQNEALRLADVPRQLELIDRAGSLQRHAATYTASHEKTLALEQLVAQLEHGDRESLRELDYLRYQAEEFSSLEPVVGELTTLEARQRLLSSIGTFQALAAQANEALADGPRAVGTVLGSLARKLTEAPDPALQEAAVACRQAAEAAQEAARLCRDALDRFEADPGELTRVEERLDAWYQMMRKHGDGEAAVLEARDRVVARIVELEGLDGRRQQAASDLASARAAREELGRDLAQRRSKAFTTLAKRVHSELADLGMPKARIEFEVATMPRPSAHGFLPQQLLVATNPGLPPAPLGDVASGGETSRLMLALTVAAAEHDRTDVLVLDEIDSGVGGRLGSAIGAKLAQLGRDRTVIAITHTPQLAAAADRHYVVRKQQDDHRTQTTVSELTATARRDELADMLGGGAAAVAQAEALLHSAAQSRSTTRAGKADR